MKRKMLIVFFACVAAVCLSAGIAACTGGGNGESCNHNFEWQSDTDSHWLECTLCGEKEGAEAHSPMSEGYYGDNFDSTSHWSICMVCEQPCNIQPHEFTEGYWQDGDTDSWEQVLKCNDCNFVYGTGKI